MAFTNEEYSRFLGESISFALKDIHVAVLKASSSIFDILLVLLLLIVASWCSDVIQTPRDVLV